MEKESVSKRIRRGMYVILHPIQNSENIKQAIADIQNNLDTNTRMLENAIKNLEDIIRQRDHSLSELQRQIDESAHALQVINEHTKVLETSLAEKMDIISTQVTGLRRLHVDETYIKRMNMLLSSHPTIWGDEDKIHVSPLAAVSSCVFNTNSGEIWIDDHTFAGMGVSVLAGSHDMQLSGFMRRDAEVVCGCDIKIGKGVWLASNCTILGPAQIHDNAVIAAGAVVVPGTVVEENAVYGGVPAKKIGTIKMADITDYSSPAVLRVLEQYKGVVFKDGWTERRLEQVQDQQYIGHYLIAAQGELLVGKNEINLFYKMDKEMSVGLKMTLNGERERTIVLETSSGVLNVNLKELFGELENDVNLLSFELEDKEITWFLANSYMEG